VSLTKAITLNRPLELVQRQWRAIEGINSNDRVVVTFTSVRGAKETEVRVELLDEETAGALGKLMQKAFGTGDSGDVDRALRQFKQLVEVGEITLSDASIHDGKHPARPPAHNEATLTPPYVSVGEAVQS
jgi:uncharacterized membrane protein